MEIKFVNKFQYRTNSEKVTIVRLHLLIRYRMMANFFNLKKTKRYLWFILSKFI